MYSDEMMMYKVELMLKQLTAGKTIIEMIIFLSYILVCAALFKRRFSRSATAIALGAAGIVIVGVNVALMLPSPENYDLMLTLFPLTAYLPFSVLLYFLSDSGIFDTAAVCSVGALEVLILKSLQKILTCFVNPGAEGGTPRFMEYFMYDAVVTLAAAGLVFLTFRFIGREFRFCVIENRQNRLLLSVPVIMIFLMIFYYLNSTTNVITLLLTMLIALSIFFVIAKLLSSGAELIRVRRSEKEMSEYIDIQRRGYDRVIQKMEATREYRHDMRHHLAVIEGLAKQGENDKIVEYTSNLNGSFGKLEGMSYCKNPEVNAILSEYIGRAESAGCRITQSLMLPEMLPFEENDVCLVLANTIDNAINACSELPEEKRYVNISAEYEDGHRLLVSVVNPCSRSLEFDENGLPVIGECSDEHGIGLRSVKRIVEKYNGFMRCMLENGEFVFQAALFYDNSSSKRKDSRPGSIPKRAVSSLLGMVLGVIVMLNVLPSTAEAASELLSVNIRTIRSLVLGWGSSSISIFGPEFDGNSELNNAVKNYTDEAKEKFLWYFSRKYDGYVAENMTYTVIRDDEKYFIAQFNVTINAGGSFDYGRWIVYDKSAGKVLELSDLFKDGSDYIGVISAEILRDMKEKNELYDYGYFVDGEDAFTEIGEDINFYIDEFDRIVIVFDEYEVAPGSVGSPKFFINNKVLEEIRR
ncbi:MAG: GHKL domain-containing protein [Oscillospiraceae bacterium]|nr:GHKL domain-containing protein [Oscillospiraceae bacterium]